MKLTKPQQRSLLRKYIEGQHDTSYYDFRRSVKPTFHMSGAVVVDWCGMWLAIETDGYTHS